MADVGGSLGTAFDYVWDRFTARLAGLTDAEYFWEPVPGCWSLRQAADGRWLPDGGGGGGPAPDPAPVTTIAWRIAHVGGLALAGFADRLFGPGTLTVADIEFPATSQAALGFLDESFQRWRTGLVGQSDAEMWSAAGPGWGIYAESTVTDLALHVLDELVHHAAEISLLRDLYRQRSELGSSGSR